MRMVSGFEQRLSVWEHPSGMDYSVKTFFPVERHLHFSASAQARAFLAQIGSDNCLLQQGVEEQLESAVGLRAVLGRETEEYDLAFPHFGPDHGRLAGEVFFADQPATN